MPLLALLALLAALGSVTRQAAASEALPQRGAAIDATSVSGLSSGAYMAGQVELAHSRQIVGVGIVAGGPFGCAESAASRLVPYWPTAVLQNAEKALNGCMSLDWGTPDPGELATRAKELADEGEIDRLDGLADDKVYLFSGDLDRTILRPIVEAAKSFYAKVGVPDKRVTLVERKGGHAFLTENKGEACDLSESPFVNDCDYDQAKAILDWIYGPLAGTEADPKGRYAVFDQSEFGKPGDGLAAEGVAYVPPTCAEAPGCRVHIVLHGCEQARERVGDDFIKESGFTRLADANRLIILFPQIAASSVNPHGCWDWWGYTGLDYLGRERSGPWSNDLRQSPENADGS